MDRVGKHTTGQVTNWYISGSKSRTYNLEYTFTRNDKVYHHTSPVTKDRYYSTHQNEQVSVIYVPGDPDICRMTDSVGPQDAASQRIGAFIFVGLATALVGIVYFAVMNSMVKQALRKN